LFSEQINLLGYSPVHTIYDSVKTMALRENFAPKKWKKWPAKVGRRQNWKKNKKTLCLALQCPLRKGSCK
jgi:hypothetical protein